MNSSIDKVKSPKELSHPKYRPDIDGLRAVAVLSVILFHAFPMKLRGGFIGVDIFFIISGFLISSIIFSNLERNSFSFFEFYSRRIKRIFPSLLIVLISCLLFGWFVLFVDEYKQLSKHIVAGAGFVSNFVLWYESGYFDNASDSKPLLHLWSLAIEEQFYIFWPLLLAFVWKRKWSFVVITALIATVSFICNIYFSNTNITADFYSPISRFWELMIGGFLAYIILHRPHWLNKYQNIQSILGCILLALGLFFINREREFPGWWALLPTIGTFLVISAGSTAVINRWILSNKLLVWIGLISYPLYLWHWSLLSFLHILEGATLTREMRFYAIFLAIILSWLTYLFIEKPFRFGGNGKIKTIILFSFMLCLFIGGIISNQYIQPRLSNLPPYIQNFVSASSDWEYPNNLKRYSNDIMSREYYIASQNSGITLLLGDSHLEQYSARIVNVVKNNPLTANTAIFITNVGCPPIPNVVYVHTPCTKTVNRALEIIKKENVKAIVVAGCWNCYFINALKPDDPDYYVLDNGKKEHFRHGQGVKIALQKLESLLKELSKSTKVYFLLDNPSGKYFRPTSFFVGTRLGKIEVKEGSQMTKINPEQVKIRDKLSEIAIRAGAEIIDPTAKLCTDKECYRTMPDIGPIYRDVNHLRSSYVRENADYLDKVLFSH